MKIEIDKPVVPQWFDDWYKTFRLDKNQPLYYLSRTGWGHPLTDGKDIEVEGCFDKLRDLSNGDGYGYEDAQEYLAKAILLGYEVEKEQRYYAKIKGWEIAKRGIYWNTNIQDKSVFPHQDKEQTSVCKTQFTKEEWNALGINYANADFEEVE